MEKKNTYAMYIVHIHTHDRGVCMPIDLLHTGEQLTHSCPPPNEGAKFLANHPNVVDMSSCVTKMAPNMPKL